MGTKKNPGAFDCYKNAKPNEPMFVLLGRDEQAPYLVRTWAAVREQNGEDPAKVAEARACADQMEEYAKKRREEKERDTGGNGRRVPSDKREDAGQEQAEPKKK